MSVKISNYDFYSSSKSTALLDSSIKNNDLNIYQEAGDLKAKYRDGSGTLYNKTLTASASSSPYFKTYSASDLANSIIGAQVSLSSDGQLNYLSFANTGSITISLEVPAEYAGAEAELSYSMYCPNAIRNHSMTISPFLNRSGAAVITSGGGGTAFANPLSANILSRQSHSVIPASATQAGDTISIILTRLYRSVESPRLISASVKFLA